MTCTVPPQFLFQISRAVFSKAESRIFLPLLTGERELLMVSHATCMLLFCSVVDVRLYNSVVMFSVVLVTL